MKNRDQREQSLYYLQICWKWKWVILLCFALGMGHGFYQFVNTPRFYEAEISLMILEQSAMETSFAGISGLLQMGGKPDAQSLTMLNILQSRRMAEDIAKHFDFEKRYGIDRFSAIGKARGMVYATTLRKLLIIRTSAEEKQLAVDLAYFCAENLKRFNAEFQIDSAKFWVEVLDPPELSVRLKGREIQKRLMMMESALGFFIGIALVVGGHEFLKLRKVMSGSVQ